LPTHKSKRRTARINNPPADTTPPRRLENATTAETCATIFDRGRRTEVRAAGRRPPRGIMLWPTVAAQDADRDHLRLVAAPAGVDPVGQRISPSAAAEASAAESGCVMKLAATASGVLRGVLVFAFGTVNAMESVAGVQVSNLVGISTNREFRIEARLQNASEEGEESNVRVEYSLYSAKDNGVLWRRKGETREGGPIRVFVDDSKWVIIWTRYDRLKMIDPSGTTVAVIHIPTEGIPLSDAKYANRERSGMPWSSYSLWTFVIVEQRPYFCIRTWWARRLIWSLDRQTIAADEGALRVAAEAAERRLVLSILEKAAEVGRKWSKKNIPEYENREPAPWNSVEDLVSAIYMSSQLKIREAVPLLRELEPIASFATGGGGYDEDIPEGELLIASRGFFDGIRHLVQQSLRQLGVKPAGFPVRQMVTKSPDHYPGLPYVPSGKLQPRPKAAAAIKRDMIPKEVVDILGAPDEIRFPNLARLDYSPTWEYEIDASPPYTLRLVWASRRLKDIEKVDPPLWKTKVIGER